MFLAALILASKYLQDRNYSARAWSKISGLGTQEIMINELTFLKAIDWRLHISEVVFQRWTDLVLKFTTPRSSSPVSPLRTSGWKDDEERKNRWCELILRLSPDLREGDESFPRVEPSPDLEIEFGPPLETAAAAAAADADAAAPAAAVAATAATAAAAAAVAAPAAAPYTVLQRSRQLYLPPPPVHTLPPRTLKPRIQQANAFAALHHMSGPSPVTSSFTFPSLPASGQVAGRAIGSGTPAAGPHPSGSGLRLIAPRAGAAMASVARSVKSSTLSSCSQEAYPAAYSLLEKCPLNVSRPTPPPPPCPPYH